ncbi:MAG: sugar ABC transporter permease [Syntrophothermus sp.]
MRRSIYRRAQGDSPAKLFFIYLVLIIFTIITVYPILNVFSVSLRPNNRLYSTSLAIIPDDATLQAYKAVMFEKPFLQWLKNSLIVSLATSVFGVALASTTAYAFSRFRFRGHKAGMTLFLVAQMFPIPMFLLPLYILLGRYGLTDTLLGLTAPYVALTLPFSIWMLKGYYDTIPRELEESASIDGASPLGAFYRVILPLSLPALAVTGLFSFMTGWSEYIVARVVLTQPGLFTLPLGLVNLQGQFSTEWGNYSAAAVLIMVPVMALFLSLSKFLISGLTLGSVKG